MCTIRSVFILSIVSLALAGEPGLAATVGEARVGFSAERTLVINGKSYVGRMIAMPGMERHEQQIQGFQPIFILRADSPLGEVVLAQLHTIVQFAFPPELRIFARPELKKDPVGHESVNGIATTEYAIDETVPEGRATGKLWLSAQGIPMRLAASFDGQNGKKTELRWELRHVKLGPQPAELFEAPAGYSKLPAEAIAPLLGMRLKSAAR